MMFSNLGSPFKTYQFLNEKHVIFIKEKNVMMKFETVPLLYSLYCTVPRGDLCHQCRECDVKESPQVPLTSLTAQLR